MGMLLVISSMDWFEAHATLQSEIVSFRKRRMRRLSIHRLSYIIWWYNKQIMGTQSTKATRTGICKQETGKCGNYVKIQEMFKPQTNQPQGTTIEAGVEGVQPRPWEPRLSIQPSFPVPGLFSLGPMIRNHQQSQDLCVSQATSEFWKCWPPRFKIGNWMVQTPNCITTIWCSTKGFRQAFQNPACRMRRLLSCWHHRFPLWPAFLSLRTPRTCQQWTVIGRKSNYFLGPQIKDISTTTSPANSIRRLVKIPCWILRFASYTSYTAKTKIAKNRTWTWPFPLKPSLGVHMLVWENLALLMAPWPHLSMSRPASLDMLQQSRTWFPANSSWSHNRRK